MFITVSKKHTFTRVCGFSTCICLIYRNDYMGICGTLVNNLRYPDDTVIVAESEEQLQRLINVVVAKSEENVLLNYVFQIDKYSYMPYRRPREYSGTSTVVHLYRKFVFLRCKIRRRIGIAKSSFTSMNKVLTSRNIDTAVRWEY